MMCSVVVSKMDIIHNISAVETNTEEGHAFFSVKCENGKEYIITSRNILSLEKNESTPEEVLSAISFIWKTLSIENCHITPEVLKLVFDYENVLKEEETFSKLISEKGGNDADKSAPITTKMVCQSLLQSKTNDMVEHFIKSKLGILLLRDMVNVTQKRTRRQIPLAPSVIKALDRQYIESPFSSCYVKGINIEVADTKKTVKYIRSKPKFVYGMNNFLQTANADVPTQKQFDEANSKGTDTFYTYGQVISSRLGHIGDYTESDDDFKRKKQMIEQRWAERENYANLSGNSFSKPKWYDSYAGTKEVTQAKYKLVLTDAPPLSVFSSLSAMKRNLITFVYMALAFREFSCKNGDVITEEDLQWMGQKFSRYFMNDETLLKTYKTPLKLPSSKRSPYLKIEEFVFQRTNGAALRSGERQKLLERGLNEEVVSIVEKIEDRSYKSLDLLNVYSKLNLTEKERQSLTGDGEERDSILLVPLTLGSYEELSGCRNTTKFISGIKDRVNYYEMPIWVAKSTLLYEKLTKEATRTLSSGKRLHNKEAVADAKELAYKLLASGYEVEDVCSMLSLSENMKQELLAETEDEPLHKKQRSV